MQLHECALLLCLEGRGRAMLDCELLCAVASCSCLTAQPVTATLGPRPAGFRTRRQRHSRVDEV